MASKRPNIIFIETDSHDGRVMGCMGHPAMRQATPNMDALARRGVIFENAYCNNPICCPSRASMWSGQYTFNCEAWNNYKGLADGDPTFQTFLEDAGYDTKILGKTDFLSGRHSIRARVTAWTRAAGILRPAYRMHPPQVLESQEERVHARDWEKVDAGIEYLRSAKNAGRPFFLYVGISAPHPPFTISRRWLDLIPENAVSLPPPDEYDHPVLQYQRVSKNWEHGLSPELVRLVRRIYCAMIAEVDGMAGLLLDAVEEMGLNESTYVIFCSDHGEMAFDHGQFYKMSPFEGSSRVPLIVTGPDVKRGVRTPALASLVDIFPTLMDMAGLKRPGWVDGHSLLPELRGGRNERPDWALLEYHDTSCCTGTFMLRRGDWKYVALPGYEPLLFNLKDDPDETRNLAPVRPETAKEMDRLLRSIVEYDTVDARAKAYDRESFRRWREKERAAGTYEKNMAWIYSGFDRMKAEDAQPWTTADEALIEKWLAQGSGR